MRLQIRHNANKPWVAPSQGSRRGLPRAGWRGVRTRGERCYFAALIASAALLASAPARAGLEDPTVEYTFNHYSDVHGVTVYGQYVTTTARLRDVGLSMQWVNDRVVYPAINAPPGSQEAVDAITTASRPISANANPYEDYVKTRNSIETTATYHGYSFGYYVSVESDYFAQMVTLGYNHGFRGDNLNISTAGSYSWDHIKPLADDDTHNTPDYRRTVHGNIVATQVLTRTASLRLGTEINHVTGLQHDPYRNVYVAGTNVPENAPNERLRRDVFVDFNKYINNKSSLNLDYRYYSDDWGVVSHAAGLKLNQYITNNLVFRYRYRYYTQAAAMFYRDDYTQPGGVNGYMTGDYRLSDFGAHLFGGRVQWHTGRLLRRIGVTAPAQLMFSYERYFNSNNFSASIVETGLSIAF
jgi:Protein of unknown function (DUF3570)